MPNELEIRVLLSIQRALWGEVYPSIRAIYVGFDGLKMFKLLCIFDREPTEDDFENMSCVSTEVLADIEFENEKIECKKDLSAKIVYPEDYILVYRRKEDFEN